MRILLAILAVVAMGLMLPSAFAYTISDDATGGDCTQIGTWDSASRTCTFSNNISEQIIVGSNNITLDGNGYTIDWDGNGSSISSTIKTGIIIKNFMIINSGITFSDTLNSIIENNTLQASGIGLGNSPNTIIRNNTISLSDSCGIGTSGSDNTEILDNTISDSGTALCFDDNFEQGHIIKGNILRDNQFGINVFARMLVIEDNEIVNNSNTGIYIKDHSVEHQILSNTISNNDVGIDVNGNPWPTLINNLFSTNNVGLKIWDGIELSYNNNFVNTF